MADIYIESKTKNENLCFLFFLGTLAKNGSTQSAFQLGYRMVGEPLSWNFYISIHNGVTFKIKDQKFL